MNVTIEAKHVYGETKFYPKCRNAKIFASITNTKTLTYQTLHYIKALGYEVVVEQEEIKI